MLVDQRLKNGKWVYTYSDTKFQKGLRHLQVIRLLPILGTRHKAKSGTKPALVRAYTSGPFEL